MQPASVIAKVPRHTILGHDAEAYLVRNQNDLRFGFCHMLNERQNRVSLRRMSELNANWIGVGHGDPVTSGGADKLRQLVQSLPNT